MQRGVENLDMNVRELLLPLLELYVSILYKIIKQRKKENLAKFLTLLKKTLFLHILLSIFYGKIS